LLDDFERIRLSKDLASNTSNKLLSKDSLKRFSKLENYLQVLSEQTSINSVRALINNNQKDLEAIISYLKRDRTSHVFNTEIHEINQIFNSFMIQLNLVDLYFPIRLDSNLSNDFYKSISIIIYGTINLWQLIKVGVLFVIFKHADQFDDLLFERNERFSANELLYNACKNDFIPEDYVQRALLILLDRPISYVCLCYNDLNGFFKKNINYMSPDNQNQEDYDSKSFINLIGMQSAINSDFFSYAPLLPLDKNTVPISDLLN
jgi:hypothetical protein